MKALIINCTLKPSPEFSNTDALIQKAVTQFRDLGVDTEVIRLLDYDVKFGTEKDMGNGDQWPLILQKIKDCNIFIIATPIWMGHIASTAQQVIERLDAIFHDEDLSDPDDGQFFPYSKVAGCLITGNEDGAHACAAHILWAMQESGFTIPPNVNAYWTGLAGAGKDYVEAGGEKWWFTNYTLRYMTSNLAWFAKLLQDNPIPTDLKALKELAKAESPR
ncbi:flavodoxin family protein [Mucilaginibacter myungsuensis]|uniref:Flavodoxin family protein n=1 Tax=Mucilaginibacter myungsuensis TaxID=649104 RepID=A0A929L1M1_9SPHI|nr:flavodoxin family protein [Mucilaginibacter myungsuensis]MBE9662445.1 flavodoxin family protein [Mucilaginibacter myungsuensis]MDN3597865.1 flavodoxin family protein [Mucilaginibacter myungsuensis]